MDRRADVYSLAQRSTSCSPGKPPFGGAESSTYCSRCERGTCLSSHAIVGCAKKTWRRLSSSVSPRKWDSGTIPRTRSGGRLAALHRWGTDSWQMSMLFRIRKQYRKHRAPVHIGNVRAGRDRHAGKCRYSRESPGLNVRQQLAQRLGGSEMKDMEWLLRTARGMPVHDLEREKRSFVRGWPLCKQSSLASDRRVARLYTMACLARHMGLREYPKPSKNPTSARKWDSTDVALTTRSAFIVWPTTNRRCTKRDLPRGGEWADKAAQRAGAEVLQPALLSLQKSRGYCRTQLLFGSADCLLPTRFANVEQFAAVAGSAGVARL